jgi:predicted DNA-binding transcriptional regulator AlpA
LVGLRLGHVGGGLLHFTLRAMKSDYASSKTALAERLQISRPTLYTHLHRPDAPRPKSNGMWRVSEVRKYIAKQEGKRELKSTEKQELELQLLRKRIRIADLQISDLDNSRAEEIAGQIVSECRQIITALTSQLSAMPNQLSGIFSTLGGPMEIYKQWRDELNQRFESARDALRKVEQKSRRKSNVVPFSRLKWR